MSEHASLLEIVIYLGMGGVIGWAARETLQNYRNHKERIKHIRSLFKDKEAR